MKLFKNKKRILIGVGALLLLMSFSPIALAETAEATSTDPFNDVAADLMRVVVIAFSFLRLLLYPLVTIVGALMDNELIIGPGMEDKLRAIWVIIRDWVNITFVLALVGVAIYNVLGIAGDGSNYALKSILPKIVIGLVAVNFSFLAGKVLLDATSVLTTAVYALPSDLQIYDGQAEKARQNLCDHDPDLTDNNGVFQEEAGKLLIEDGNLLAAIFCETEEGDTGYYSGDLNDFGEDYFNNFGAHNVAVLLMINMGQVMDVNLVSFSSQSTLDQFTSLTLQTLFGILLFLMFGFAFVAMVVVLLVRIVILWICLALSPFLVLFFLFPDIAGSLGGELDIKSQFFKHLFVPVVMGVVFSIGFTMLAVFQETATGGWLGKFSDIELNELENISESEEVDELFGRDITQFQDLIIAIAAVIIIWVGTFSAASQTLASTWTGAIKSAGESTGKFLASTPLYATVIPVKTSAGESNIGLMNALGAIPEMMRTVEANRRNRTGEFARGMLGVKGEEAFNSKVRSDVQSGGKVDAQRALKERAEAKGADQFDWRSLLTADVMGKLGLSEADQAKFRGKSSPEIYELLRTDQPLAEKVFGRENLPTQWNSKAIDEAASTSTATAETEAQKKAEEASSERKGKIKPAEEALKKAKPDGTAPATLAEVQDNRQVNLALNQVGLTPEEAASLFTDPNAEGLQEALAAYTNLSGSTKENAAFTGQVRVTDGKIDAQSFIQAVANPGGAPVTSGAPVTGTVPGIGGAPAVDPVTGLPMQPNPVTPPVVPPVTSPAAPTMPPVSGAPTP